MATRPPFPPCCPVSVPLSLPFSDSLPSTSKLDGAPFGTHDPLPYEFELFALSLPGSGLLRHTIAQLPKVPQVHEQCTFCILQLPQSCQGEHRQGHCPTTEGKPESHHLVTLSILSTCKSMGHVSMNVPTRGSHVHSHVLSRPILSPEDVLAWRVRRIFQTNVLHVSK